MCCTCRTGHFNSAVDRHATHHLARKSLHICEALAPAARLFRLSSLRRRTPGFLVCRRARCSAAADASTASA